MLDIPDKARNEREDADLAAIRIFFEERRREPFDDVETARKSTDEMIAIKRMLLGL